MKTTLAEISVKDLLAAQRVLSRDHLSETPVDHQAAEKKREFFFSMYQTGLFADDTYNFEVANFETGAPIKWDPRFTFVDAFMINRKISGKNPSLINLYYTRTSDRYTGSHDCFYCFDTYMTSSAKCVTSVRDGEDYLYINTMNSFDSGNEAACRQGSMLIQVAVEHSINHGRGGRVQLISSRQSGQFYFKLGFLPRHESILESLVNGEDVDGREMYLPQESIDAWKTKIAKRPLLTHDFKKLHQAPASSASTYFAFFNDAASLLRANVYKVGEALTGCCRRT